MLGGASQNLDAAEPVVHTTGRRPLPVVIDTDIGDDFDDSWALALALACPHLWDVKMVLTANKDTAARAKIVAKYLALFNRTDVVIGVGDRTPGGVGSLLPWAADFDLDAYKRTGGQAPMPTRGRAGDM